MGTWYWPAHFLNLNNENSIWYTLPSARQFYSHFSIKKCGKESTSYLWATADSLFNYQHKFGFSLYSEGGHSHPCNSLSFLILQFWTYFMILLRPYFLHVPPFHPTFLKLILFDGPDAFIHSISNLIYFYLVLYRYFRYVKIRFIN